jgi:ribose/xylose/arabinose/galactoside ABC-type transport system permease subunit
MRSGLSQALRTDWFGPLAIVVAASVGITIFDPSFLSPFIQILLLAAAVNVVIAMSQMVIIAIGQMNLAIGAIGGLAAISFVGLMQVWSFPPAHDEARNADVTRLCRPWHIGEGRTRLSAGPGSPCGGRPG